jgi:phospholipase/carboxylesterase
MLLSLRGVIEGHSSVCPASSRALLLENAPVPRIAGTSLASMDEPLEPVHLHGVFDTSLHLCLPVNRAREVCALGWGEPHRYVGHETEIMFYGPRDRVELLLLIGLVRESIAFAAPARP